MDQMTDTASDMGFTLTEVMVVVALMGMVLATAYSAMQVMTKAGSVTQTQSILSREVATPQQIIDKVVSQNKQIYNSGSLVSDGYTLSVRTPKAPTVTTYQLRVYKALADGRFTESIYDQATLQATPVFNRTVVWSTHNANREKGIPVFTYYASDVATTPPQARSITINLVAKSDGKYVSSTRRIFFRNR